MRLLSQHRSFTAREVLQRLKADRVDDPRTVAVLAAAAQISVWSSLLSQRMAVDLGRAAHRLPTVVYWYREGVALGEIGRRLSPLGSDWDANRALDAAALLIAESLNQRNVAPLPV
jgi:hypothetical protein